MTNHEKLLQAIKADKMLADSPFSHAEVSDVAEEILRDTTKSGIAYAVLKFLQIYCTCTNGNSRSRAFFAPKTDPRKFPDLEFIKHEGRFKLKADVPEKPKTKPIPSTKKSAIEQEIEKFEKNWKKRDIPKKGESWVPWSPFGDDWTIDSDRCNPHPDLVEERKPKKRDSDSLRPTDDCLSKLQEIWCGDPREEVHKFAGKGHWHCYQIEKVGQSFWKKWRSNPAYDPSNPSLGWCKNVSEAGDRWSWSDSSTGPFETIALALQCAVAKGDNKRAAAICLRILSWGGVRRRARSFVNWIFDKAATNDLCKELIEATRLLIPQSSASIADFNGRRFFMDSSSTKIYAALALDLSGGVGAAKQDVLIYDGRVAGALGLIARYACSRLGHGVIPADLMFPVDPTPRRNPSCPPHTFPVFAYNAPGHTNRANFARIAARWIQAVTGATGPSAEFIRAEQGLFMIGYDVRQRCDGLARCLRALKIASRVQPRI
jgi:hypothetical protein